MEKLPSSEKFKQEYTDFLLTLLRRLNNSIVLGEQRTSDYESAEIDGYMHDCESLKGKLDTDKSGDWGKGKLLDTIHRLLYEARGHVDKGSSTDEDFDRVLELLLHSVESAVFSSPEILERNRDRVKSILSEPDTL